MNKETILGLIRHGLTFAGGILVTKGLADEATSTELIGGLIAVIGAIWSIIQKRSAANVPAAMNLFVAFILLPSALILSSCGSIKPTGAIDTTYGADGTVTASSGLDIGTNASVVGTGSYNVATGHWTAGISIVFKDEISAALAASELAAYNLGPAPYTRSSVTWQIAKWTRTPAQLTAVEIALKNGATIKGL